VSRIFKSAPDPSELKPPENLPQGLYLYGDVGTGKTMLMDLFYNTLPLSIKRKRRVHFHAFMIDVHKRLHAVKAAMGYKGGDPLPPVARQLAEDAYVLCFDEFQVRRIDGSISSTSLRLFVCTNLFPLLIGDRHCRRYDSSPIV
jgi:peroxisome-assembly ATPase